MQDKTFTINWQLLKDINWKPILAETLVGSGLAEFFGELSPGLKIVLFSGVFLLILVRVAMGLVKVDRELIVNNFKRLEYQKAKAATPKITSHLDDNEEAPGITEYDLDTMNKINCCVSEIFDKTSADRFVIIRLLNGKVDMKFSKPLYERHDTRKPDYEKSLNVMQRFFNVQLDQNAKELFLQSQKYGVVDVITKTLDEKTLTGGTYTSEELSEVLIFFVSASNLSDGRKKLIYISVGTHDKAMYSLEERKVIFSNAETIRKNASEYANRNN